MTDAAGAPQVEYEYAAFGDTIETTGAADNLRGYGAHWRDDESHLLYMGARYQDPVLGRFTQPDPVIPEPGDPQSWNRYSYVRNNPVNRIDPTGNIDTAADIANRWQRNADEASQVLSDSVLDSGSGMGAAVAAATQTAIDIGGGAVDMLRLGEGAAEGGWGYARDALRAVGIVSLSAQGLAPGARSVAAAQRGQPNLSMLHTRGVRPIPGSRTIQGQVDAAVEAAGGNPTVVRGGQDLVRLRSSGHGSEGATATPQNVRNVNPKTGQEFVWPS